MKLLTVGNPKTEKGSKKRYLTSILHLAPARLSGFNVCPMATAGCEAACLNTAGRGGLVKGFKTADVTPENILAGVTLNVIQSARIAKTKFFFNDRPAFMTQLVKEIKATIAKAEKLDVTPVFRLNGTSDIRWETIAVGGFRNVMEMFPNVQFYDYTKIPNRKNIPANYHLTFSLADGNDAAAEAALKNGLNVAAVFRSLPDTYMDRPVVNGDDTDLRFLDPAGTIIGLKAKGKAKSDTTGFVRN